MDILKALREKKSELQQQVDTIDAAINLLSGKKDKKRKRTMSASARRKMSLAAKNRWKVRKAKG